MKTIIDNIFNEKSLVKSEFYHVVPDAEPICKEHLLVFPKITGKAFLSYSSQYKKKTIDFLRSEFGKDYYFFEKGNSSFCTSFVDGSYCHFHIVPKFYFDSQLILKFVDDVVPNITQPDIAIATLEIKQPGEYLLFGQPYGNVYLRVPFFSFEKRFIRSKLSNCKLK